jgi:hypothetical protein
MPSSDLPAKFDANSLAAEANSVNASAAAPSRIAGSRNLS